MTKFTERQAAAWPEAIAEIQRYVDTSTVSADPQNYCWTVLWAEESRPGRGHYIDAIWCDGEYMAQVTMDVYGYPNVSVARTELIHNRADEECPCTPCTTEREEDQDD